MSDEPIDLYRRNVPPEIIELIPASVARENRCVPVRQDDGGLLLAMADMGHSYVLEKLRFILNTRVRAVQATPEAIEFALLRYYPD
jgi:type IV pilus assembly protein PilB